MNRFSNDTGSVDNMLASKLFIALDLLASNVATFIPVLIINWLNAFPAMLVIYFSYQISKFYTPTSQAIKRLEGNGGLTFFLHFNIFILTYVNHFSLNFLQLKVQFYLLP